MYINVITPCMILNIAIRKICYNGNDLELWYLKIVTWQRKNNHDQPKIFIFKMCYFLITCPATKNVFTNQIVLTAKKRYKTILSYVKTKGRKSSTLCLLFAVFKNLAEIHFCCFTLCNYVGVISCCYVIMLLYVIGPIT